MPLARRHHWLTGALCLLLMAGLAAANQQIGPPQGAAPAADEPGWVPAWYIVLGSFSGNPQGAQQAHARAEQIGRALALDNLVISETEFYRGLRPGLHVVMAGPYQNAVSARDALDRAGIRRIVPDAYVKQVSERLLE